MASQRSILSFFGKGASSRTVGTTAGNGTEKDKTSPKGKAKEALLSPPRKKRSRVSEEAPESPNPKVTKSSTKQRLKRPKHAQEKPQPAVALIEEEEDQAPAVKQEEEDSPVKVAVGRRKRCRARIESSSEEEQGEEEEEVKEVNTIKEEQEESTEEGSDAKNQEEKENQVEEKVPANGPSTEPEVRSKNPKKQDDKQSEARDKEANPTKKKSAFAAFFSGPKGAQADNQVDAEGSHFNETVTKSRYDPIEDAFWARGSKTPYMAFAKTLQAIEATSGRLKTIEILANYFRSVMVLTPEDLLPSVYMCLNRLAPAYEGLELGIGDMILIRTIAQTTGRSVQQIKTDAERQGDLGLVAETSRGSQRTMFQPAALTLPGVFEKLKDVAKLTGHSSTSAKQSKIQGMLVACKDSEARYLIRSLAGKLRIGLAEQSVLQALAHACVMTPPGQEYPPRIISAFKDSSTDIFKAALEPEALALKTAYCECPNYDLVIPVLLQDGIGRLSEKCKLTPGIPLKPMLAHPTKGVQEVLTRFENSKFTCEWKYDGERAQIHLRDNGEINIYSRNQEDNTTKYPDIISRFESCKGDSVTSCVLDSEAVAWDKESKQILPFQILSTRKRKDASASEIKVQVALFAFDLLYLNGESLVRKTFRERRALLQQSFREVEGEFFFAKSADPETMEEVQEVLEESVKDNCEGLMVKTLDVDATYEIAKRSHNWLKLKKDYLDGVGDTLDVVVLGGYLGRGKRTGSYGGFLLGCYDQENEEYQSLCKIGTGFSDEDLTKHKEFFKDHIIEKAKSYYAFDSSLRPDHWFEPVQVWEIKAADLSISPVHRAGAGIVDPDRGISLRFPRFIRVRDDKAPEDATSAQQVADMYNSQEQVKNTKGGKASKGGDEFDF